MTQAQADDYKINLWNPLTEIENSEIYVSE